MNPNRAGEFIKYTSYATFHPKPLPPDPPLMIDEKMQKLLSEADMSVGRLDGITHFLPDPDLFVAMYVQKEAVLSSQIEGTQASLSDVLQIDVETEKREDVAEVVNYVNAINYGLERLNELPISLRLIREVHKHLLRSGRGSRSTPGEFRVEQNWIGPAGCSVEDATFVPPNVTDMREAISDLEKYFHVEDATPALIKIAFIHAQFETIHPFIDGNGRMGRLLITLWLCQQKILSKPLLYLSYYFKKNRYEYYDNLMRVRKKGDWERWVTFFLEGVSEVSTEATQTAIEIVQLKKSLEKRLSNRKGNNYHQVIDLLFKQPIITNNIIREKLNLSHPTAGKMVDYLMQQGIICDISPERKRNKRYAFIDYISILNRGTELN